MNLQQADSFACREKPSSKLSQWHSFPSLSGMQGPTVPHFAGRVLSERISWKSEETISDALLNEQCGLLGVDI